MKKINTFSSIRSWISFMLLMLFSLSYMRAQDGDASKGAELFKTHCSACHTLDSRLVGPPLKNVADKRSKEWIHSFVKNSTEFRKKDKDAQAIFEEYNIPMTSFENTLSDADIDDIIAYTSVGDAATAKKEDVPPATAEQEENSGDTDTVAQEQFTYEPGKKSTWWYWLVTLVFTLLVYLLAKKKQYFWAIFTTIIGLLSVAYFMFAWLMQVGVDQGYKPVQPIEFSHRVHAGDNGIDCEYCHSSAKHSKTSGIPSADVCMNCHKMITEYKGDPFGGHDKAFFDGEIAKVHEAAGWDKSKFAYTGKGKGIEWTRVHNLPDFAYYNHSQHVNVAGLSCQTCHGPVEEMDRVEQFSPLTMDWCISCHREKQVDMKNGYYQATYHDKEWVKGATVAEMGGQECGKCHY
jgi:mono/diheme cytochrome c family protein